MSLRRDFLVHKRKTVESFRFVRSDISGINAALEHIKNSISSLDSKLASVDIEAGNLKRFVEKCASDIGIQENYNLSIQSKIDVVNKLISETVSTLGSFKSSINDVLGKILSRNQQTSNKISSYDKSIKKLFVNSKKQSLRNKQLTSSLKQNQEESKKLRNLLNKKLKTYQRKENEIESKIKHQRKLISLLNNKIEGKKWVRKIVKRTITKKITPRKTVTKTVTPKKTVTETVTPKRKIITEVKK